jgi:YVTN family beta-propeller protein
VLFLTSFQIARAQTQLATVQLNPYPQAISYNPVTNKIYVVDEPTSEVAEIDGISFQATLISLGPTSQQALNAAIRINPNTNTIYVTNVVDNNIAIVSGATHAVSFVAAGVNPVAMEINLVTNKLYVANFGSNTVTVLNGATNSVKSLNVGASPSAIAINPITNATSASLTVTTTLSRKYPCRPFHSF